jgi:hypothetical protein
MTESKVQDLIKKYNDLQLSANYWIDGGLRLVKYLNKRGMKYRDIYAIMENRAKDSEAA